MDLPTYTNIWRIEKRLYKLYDFRLPMPLPVGQITVFAAIALPYVVLLTLLSVPFSHSLVWLYVLPPGLVTWLVTRPVLEGKRLPELVRSHLRYLAEPRVWCRMAPLSESDVIVVTGRVWRLSAAAREQVSAAAEHSNARTQLMRRLTRVRPAGARPNGARRPVSAPETAASAQGQQRQAPQRPAPQWPAPQWPAPQWPTQQRQAQPAQAQQAQVRAGQGRSAPVRAGAASARAARAAAVRARAAESALPESQPSKTAQPPRPGIAAGTDWVRAAAAPPVVPGLVHPPVRPVPPDQPVVLRERPLRSPTAPPTRSAAAAARPEPLSIPRQAASPDADGPPAVPAVLAGGPESVGPPIGSALAPAPHSEVAEEAPVHPQAGPERKADPHPKPEAAPFALSESADREPVRLDPTRPHITVVNAGATAEPAPAVERMLAGPSVRRGEGISGRVLVVPGGHRPGKPDQLQRDRARAQLPVAGPRRVVVLGCTVGAGQTITALLTGEALAGLRSEPVAALDLNPGANSLAHRSRLRPALGQVASLGPPRLAILGPPSAASTAGPAGAGPAGAGPAGAGPGLDPDDPAAGLAHAVEEFERATAAHQIVLADPSTTVVPRLLSMADQLILVAPASAAAARAISMTFEWLDAHGYADLASEAIMVMNGVSRRSTAHVEQAERGCIGRCRAIVRVPWDDQLGLQAAKRGSAAAGGKPGGQWAGPVGPATAGAYTALAGVLVVALADQAGPGDDDDDSGGKRPGPSANATARNSSTGTGWGAR